MVVRLRWRARRSPAAAGGLVLLLAAATLALAGAPPASAQSSDDRYSLVHGCFALQSAKTGKYVAKSGGSYAASQAGLAGAEGFRMQATDLGSYLFYGRARDFLSASDGRVGAAAEPSNRADWIVREAGSSFVITNLVGRQLAVAGDGSLIAVHAGRGGAAGRFEFVPASGCPRYPEVDLSATGAPSTGSPRYGEVAGWSEGHMHGMAYEFLGGKAHCGQPFHRYGAPYALVDCEDHEVANGCAAVLENVLYGEPVRCHDPVGWPTFKDWPHHQSLTHEQSYWKWLERAWMGGMRLYVNLMVENRVLCELYPYKQNSCNEMTSVLKQIRRIQEFEDYIDAQSGGPGKGFFRIVDDPFEARQVINDGKLAVVLGMEVSEPFGCGLSFDRPLCDAKQITDWINRLHDLRIRQLEITNKFDNALTGVAGDSGETGTVVNAGNFYATGSFWDLRHCDEPHDHDNTPTAVEHPHNDDLIIANGINAFLPGIAVPVYPEGPHCNAKGLTPLGEHAIRTIMAKRMIFDPDHQSVKGRRQALRLVESKRYPGVISSHSWSTPEALPRILRLGGVITPSAKGSVGFIDKWRDVRDAYEESGSRQYFGLGYGADQNGFAAQGGPRDSADQMPLRYPFRSFDGKVLLDRQRSGKRVFDLNEDGVAHYGLYPDWVEDLRIVGGRNVVDDLSRGAESYLQMWERTEGIDPVRCGGWKQKRLGKRGLGRRLRLGESPRATLERAGQPVRRERGWRWCASPRNESKRVGAVFTGKQRVGLILSNLKRHRAKGVATGDRKAKLRRVGAKRFGKGLWVRKAGKGPRAGKGRKFVYGVRGGRVKYVAVASGQVAKKKRTLRRHLAQL